MDWLFYHCAQLADMNAMGRVMAAMETSLACPPKFESIGGRNHVVDKTRSILGVKIGVATCLFCFRDCLVFCAFSPHLTLNLRQQRLSWTPFPRKPCTTAGRTCAARMKIQRQPSNDQRKDAPRSSPGSQHGGLSVSSLVSFYCHEKMWADSRHRLV